MKKKTLNIPNSLYQPPIVDENPVHWSHSDAESWLNSPQLAMWAKTWLTSLQQRFRDDFPRLLEQGLKSNDTIPNWMGKDSQEAHWIQQFLEQNEMAEIWFKKGFLTDDPTWLKQLLTYEKAKVARSFLLNGNISDYSYDPVHGYRPTIRLLIDTLKKEKDCVLSYRLSKGLSLHSEDVDIIDKLPQSIQSELNDKNNKSAFPTQSPLLPEVCRLFDILSAWLMSDDSDENERSHIKNFPRGVAIVFENVHLLIPPNPDDIERNFLVDSILRWSSSPELFHSSHCLILMAEALEDVGNELRASGGKIEQINIPRPETSSTRLKFLLPLLTPSANMKETRVAQLRYGLDLTGYTGNRYSSLERLSHDTAGLTLLGIEDLVQESGMSAERSLNRKTVMRLKRERLRQESDGLLEVIDPKKELSTIGGYEALKVRLKEIVVALEKSDDSLLRSTVPMGVLFLGPPGTGKSIVAEALATEAKNFSMAKLGDFRGMYVGQSERNLSRIFSLIESLHPVIVFIDEIDQALGSRSNKSGSDGVDSRIFGRFLEFMSQSKHRGKVLWIGASNFPNKVDPAMKRAGRFDLVLPFLLPEEVDRQSIIKVILELKLKDIKSLKHTLTADDFAKLAKLSSGFSGAELEAIIGEVLRRIAQKKAETGESPQIDLSIFQQVFAVYQAPPEQRKHYEEMEELAIEAVSFLDLLPEKYRKQRQPPSSTT